MITILKSCLFWGVGQDAEVKGVCVQYKQIRKVYPTESAIAVPSTMKQYGGSIYLLVACQRKKVLNCWLDRMKLPVYYWPADTHSQNYNQMEADPVLYYRSHFLFCIILHKLIIVTLQRLYCVFDAMVEVCGRMDVTQEVKYGERVFGGNETRTQRNRNEMKYS
jgi:hypothetical protein